MRAHQQPHGGRGNGRDMGAALAVRHHIALADGGSMVTKEMLDLLIDAEVKRL